jgi:hypothetical protein
MVLDGLGAEEEGGGDLAVREAAVGAGCRLAYSDGCSPLFV